MPVLRINATSHGLRFQNGDAVSDGPILKETGGSGPVVIMVHGYKYAPGHAVHCPHAKIFAQGPGKWPARLGFSGQSGHEGLALAFGWYARGALRGVHRRARAHGADLAALITRLRALSQTRPLHIVAHSLGAEAALSALAHLPAGSVDRMILMAGACHASHAEAMLDTPAGRTTDVFNITSRENDLFDAIFERLVPSSQRHDRAIGQGIDAPNVASVQIDCPNTLASLARMGFDIAPPERRICHWSAYTRQGIMRFYTRLLRSPQKMPLSMVRARLPEALAPRWSRLLRGACAASQACVPDTPALVDRLKTGIMAPHQGGDSNCEQTYRSILLANTKRLESLYRVGGNGARL